MEVDQIKQKPGFKKGKSGNPAGRPKGIKAREKRLTIPDAVEAVQLSRKGIGSTTIARVLNATPAAVKEALAGARQLLELAAPEVAANWVDAARIAAAEGDHKPAMALLQSIKVVEPVAQTYDTGTAGAKAVAAVKVELHGFTFAGLPSQPEEKPAIDVTARSTT